MKRPPHSIVIGYGNPLRGDDGVGPLVATALGRRVLPRLRTLALQQLTPELAPELAAVDRAIFVDACAGLSGPRWLALSPAESALAAHLSDPAVLLALTGALYGRAPAAWLLALPARCFTLGAPLSPIARRGVVLALRRLRRFLAIDCATARVHR